MRVGRGVAVDVEQLVQVGVEVLGRIAHREPPFGDRLGGSRSRRGQRRA